MLVKTINNIIVGPAEKAGPGVVELTEEQRLSLIHNYKEKIIKYIDGELLMSDAIKVYDWTKAREKRNRLLLEADVQAKIVDDKKILGEDVTDELFNLAGYRRDLRDITINFDGPDNVIWPQKPWEIR